MKRLAIYIFLAVCLVLMLFFGLKSSRQAKVYEETSKKISKQLNIERLATFKIKEFAEKISLGWYENKTKKEFETLKHRQSFAKKKSWKYFFCFVTVLVLLLSSWFFTSLRVFTFSLSLASGMTLFFGLTIPLLMVTIHQEIEYLGDVILSYESKSILGTIVKLLKHGNIAVATAISLFSVLVPLLKIVAIFFIAIFTENRFAHRMVKVFKSIGKWSMADVFVVALFLVYLTVDKSGSSHAETEIGLYFFMLYVIISILLTISADKMLHRID